MPLYRIAGQVDIERGIAQAAITPTPGDWPPYEPNTVVFVFESADPLLTLKRFALPIAESRNINVNGFVYLLEIEDTKGIIKQDESQNGWDGSLVHFGPIPINGISVMGDICVIESRGTFKRFNEPRIYRNTIPLSGFKIRGNQ